MTANVERTLKALLSRFDADDDRRRRLDRPFIIELFGTPKSGKTTMKEMLKHTFKRHGWLVSTPTEGAEVVEWIKRLEPDYNFQTAEYALSRARELAYGPAHRSFHVAILDRGNLDGVVRMEYYRMKGIISEAEQQAIEGYYLLPHNERLFDLHVCLVAEPAVAIRRELARALTKKHGETMNPQTLAELLEAHRRVLLRLESQPGAHHLCWHDSSRESEAQTATALLTRLLEVFVLRINGLK